MTYTDMLLNPIAISIWILSTLVFVLAIIVKIDELISDMGAEKRREERLFLVRYELAVKEYGTAPLSMLEGGNP